MRIDSVQISSDFTNLIVTITDASSANTLLFWNNDTYKDFTQSKDFSAKLDGTATQTVDISLSEINEPYFDGIYFFEAQSNTETSINYCYILTKYKECVLNGIMEMKGCDDCLEKMDNKVREMHSILMSLEYALQERFIDDAISIVKMMDKFCSKSCNTCGTYTFVNNDTIDENFETTTVILDGGSLD